MKILHFCGHGQRSGLVFEQTSGKSTVLTLDIISKQFGDLLRQGSSPPSLAYLGACQSLDSGKIVCEAGVPYVVVSTRDVPDKMFSHFTFSFYR